MIKKYLYKFITALAQHFGYTLTKNKSWLEPRFTVKKHRRNSKPMIVDCSIDPSHESKDQREVKKLLKSVDRKGYNPVANLALNPYYSGYRARASTHPLDTGIAPTCDIVEAQRQSTFDRGTVFRVRLK